MAVQISFCMILFDTRSIEYLVVKIHFLKFVGRNKIKILERSYHFNTIMGKQTRHLVLVFPNIVFCFLFYNLMGFVLFLVGWL